jgi:hypothetical protein
MDPEEDTISVLMDQLRARLPSAITRRSLRDHCTVQPVPKHWPGRRKYAIENSAEAAEKDVEELLAEPDAQLIIEFSGVEPVALSLLTTQLEITAIMMRAVMEQERDKQAAKSEERVRALTAVIVLAIILAIIAYRLFA